jgi:hypothetical protein
VAAGELFRWGHSQAGCVLSLVSSCLLATGCGDPLYAGSDVIWFADHEGADLAEWNGSYTGIDAQPAGTVEASADVARRGRYSAKLTRDAVAAESGPGLYRDVRGYPTAYYAAWFLIPEPYATPSRWTIFKFRLGEAEGFDLDLRALPDGDFVLSAFDHDQDHLQEPIALPTPIVRVGRWFQLEVRYQSSAGAGSIVVWLDGRQVYRLDDHPTAADGAYLSPCNVALELSPSPSTLYVDEAVASLSRITPDGSLPR